MALTIRRRLVDRVRQWRKIAYAVCVALVVGASAVVFLSVSSPDNTIEISSQPTFFEAARALRFANELQTLFPKRIIGLNDARNAASWYQQRLTSLGIATEPFSQFKARLGDNDITLQNVAVVLPGSTKDSILITAPRDTATLVKIDRLAFASGTAMLNDLIQVFAARPHDKTFIFLSTDDGDNGGLGITHFLEGWNTERGTIKTIITIRGLGKEADPGIQFAVSSPRDSTPGWLVQLAGQVFSGAGMRVQVPGILSQAAAHSLSLPRGDQVAGLARGIPALEIYSDTPGSPTQAGLGTQGKAVERLLLSLDSAAQISPNPGTALLMSGGRYMTNRAITFLAVLMVLPSAAALLIWLFSSRLTLAAGLMHLRNLFSFVVPLSLIFLLAYLLALWGLIPRYHFQVPTAFAAATQPRAAPTIMLVLLGAAIFFLCRHFLGYLKPREQRATTEMARLITGFLSLFLGLVLMLSRSPFLLLPCLASAWAWPLATCFAEPNYSADFWRHRFLSNAPLLMVGLVAPLLLYSYVASGAHVGWLKSWWFLLVQTVSGAYGVRGPAAFVFITAAFFILLGAKRLRVVPVETLELTDELSLLEPPSRRRRTPKPASGLVLSPGLRPVDPGRYNDRSSPSSDR